MKIGGKEKRQPRSSTLTEVQLGQLLQYLHYRMKQHLIFCRFFTDEVWQLIVDETNRYASANSASTPHARPWSDVTIPEMKAFIGMLILMGIVELQCLEMYWQTKHPLIATTGISSVMSLVRFEQLSIPSSSKQ